MNKVFEKIIEKLEEYEYENLVEHDSEQSQHCKDAGDCEMRDCTLCIFDKAIEIVKQEAEKYEECYKDCGDCEAYNKEKHHCPKFCKVIKETVKEIEENHDKKALIAEINKCQLN